MFIALQYDIMMTWTRSNVGPEMRESWSTSAKSECTDCRYKNKKKEVIF